MSDALLAARRRLVARYGRPATLRRQLTAAPPTYATVNLTAVYTNWNPSDPRNGLAQGERRVEILADEIAAASWPGPPRKGDTLVSAEGVNAIVGSQAVYAGAILVGYTMLERGT